MEEVLIVPILFLLLLTVFLFMKFFAVVGQKKPEAAFDFRKSGNYDPEVIIKHDDEGNLVGAFGKTETWTREMAAKAGGERNPKKIFDSWGRIYATWILNSQEFVDLWDETAAVQESEQKHDGLGHRKALKAVDNARVKAQSTIGEDATHVLTMYDNGWISKSNAEHMIETTELGSDKPSWIPTEHDDPEWLLDATDLTLEELKEQWAAFDEKLKTEYPSQSNKDRKRALEEAIQDLEDKDYERYRILESENPIPPHADFRRPWEDLQYAREMVKAAEEKEKLFQAKKKALEEATPDRLVKTKRLVNT